MGRPQILTETEEHRQSSHSTAEWQALRGELVALLDQVNGRYRSAPRDNGLQAPSRRLTDIHVSDMRHDDMRHDEEIGEDNRQREALASVARAVSRFQDREEPLAGAATTHPRNSVQAAIQEIRNRQANRPQPSAAPPQLDRLVEAVAGFTGRLERLEGELKTQRHGKSEIKTIADQMGQLAHVVELLAGAVGETGQVKRLEDQIADLAASVADGRRDDFEAITGRIADLAGAIDRLVDVQGDAGLNARNTSVLASGMQAIEQNVRSIYDRIDAIERNVSLAPAEFNRLTEELAGFIQDMRAENQDWPGQLIERVDALDARLARMGNDDRLVDALRRDLDILRLSVLGAVEPRFSAIETQIGALGEWIEDNGGLEPSIAQVEAQIRQLITRMDQTGAQLVSLSKLYAEGGTGERPDYETLASMVAEKASAAFAKMPAQAAAPADANDALIGEIEQRISKLFETALRESEDKDQDFNEVQDGIKRVDERLARLETALASANRPTVPTPAPRPEVSLPAAPYPAARRPEARSPRVPDAMPANPAADAPLIDKGFGQPTQALGLDIPARPIPAALKREAPPADVVPAEPAKPTLPPRPVSSLEGLGETPVVEAPKSTTKDPLGKETAGREAGPVRPERGATPPPPSTNTFIAAHRRMAQRRAEEKAETETSNSLLARAFAGIKPGKEAAPVKTEAKAEPVAEIEAATDPEIDVQADKAPGFLTRHRQPILLVATIIAVAFLGLNLINQRMSGQSDSDEAPAVVDPQEPTAPAPGEEEKLSALPSASEPVRAIPGTGAEVVDALAVGSINPRIATQTGNSGQVAAMPPTLAVAFASPADTDADMTTAAIPASQPAPATRAILTALDAPALPDAGEDVVETAALDTLGTISPPVTHSPVKFDPPSEAIGPEGLRQAAADGDARAQFEVAAIYSEGRVVEQDYAAAFTWYERAAAQGFAPAQYRIGNLYETGTGTDKDLEEARLWYQRAAEAGNRMAMHNLAALYAGGGLGKQDFASAAEWFERAANRGMTDSQFNLGMLYARGLGVEQDLAQSYKWFSLAARTGDKDAVKARDDMAKSLDPETIAQVKAGVSAWKPGEIDLMANFAPIGTWSKDFNPGEAIGGHDVVLQVQAALNRLGFDVGTPDGVAGPKTREAIRSFEKATGMSESGTVNPRLLAVLGSQPV